MVAPWRRTGVSLPERCGKSTRGTMGISVTKKELLALLIIFIVYVLIGGGVFMALESPLEEQQRKELIDLREEFQGKLQFFNNSNLTREDIQDLIYRLASAQSNNLMDENGEDTHTIWNFYNSFFFAITVVTTIGYGHLSPSTTSGRLFCLFYAMIGIPMTGILLAAIGDHFSKHMTKRLKRAKKSYTSKVALAVNAVTFLLPWFVVFLILPAGIFMLTEGWSFVEGVYYCFITLSTIGFGDYVAANFASDYIWLYKTVVVLWIIFGLGYLAMILNYISRAMRCKHVKKMEHRLSASFHNTQQKFSQRLDEIHHLLQEFSKQRSGKSQRKGLSRRDPLPAPNRVAIDESLDVRDKNHNRDYHLQRLLKLVQSLKEDTRNAACHRHQRRRLLKQLEALDLATSEELPVRRHSLPVVLVPTTTLLDAVQSSKIKNRSNLEFLSTPFETREQETTDSLSPNGLRPGQLRVTIDLERLQSTRV